MGKIKSINALDINEKFQLFLNILLQAYSDSFPEKLVRFRNGDSFEVAWFTDDLRGMRDYLHFLNEVCKTHNTEANKKLRNDFKLRYKKIY